MLTTRRYGKAPYYVVTVHGGPGAAGDMAAVARQLSKKCGVIEPLQTKNSVQGQVDELKTQLAEYDAPFVLVGHSWGAWLSLLFARQYPTLVKQVVLVGCPPFTQEEAREILDNRIARLSPAETQKLYGLLDKTMMNEIELTQFGALMEKADTVERLKNAPDSVKAEADIAFAVWSEAETMRLNGEWEQILGAVTCPISVIHGRQDPHPYKAVLRAMEDCGAHFEMALLDDCGHSPWKEAKKMSDFYKLLQIYLKLH